MTIKKEEGRSLVSDVDLYATKDGHVVEGDHPKANSLIAAAGTPIPERLAQRFGLKATKAEPAESPKPVKPAKSDEPKAEAR